MKKYTLGAMLFLLFIAVYGAANLAYPDKPEISLQENRQLSKKPVFSMTTLFDGSFADGWDKYYSDTVLYRENLIQANIDLKKSMQSGKDNISITVIGNEPTPTKTQKPVQTAKPTATPSQTTFPEQSNAPQSSTPSPSPSPTPTQEQQPEGTGAATGMYITIGDETFKLDSYSEEDYDNYAKYINKVKDMAGDDIQVYSMLAPSRSTYLALTKYDFLASRAANIEQINSKIDKSVKNVNVLKSMVENVDQYIYYRTDHHWTHLGAYYGYVELMRTMGLEKDIIPLEQYTEKLVVEGYLGYYNKPYLTDADYKNPDTIIAYYPVVDYTYTFHWAEVEMEKRLINEDRVQPDKDYYLLFSDGGFGTYSEITTAAHSDRVCMVIKDSFGDSLISFLLPHFKTVYVVDSRTYIKEHCDNMNLIDFAKSKGVTDIVVNYWITEITYTDDFMAKAFATLE